MATRHSDPSNPSTPEKDSQMTDDFGTNPITDPLPLAPLPPKKSNRLRWAMAGFAVVAIGGSLALFTSTSQG